MQQLPSNFLSSKNHTVAFAPEIDISVEIADIESSAQVLSVPSLIANVLREIISEKAPVAPSTPAAVPSTPSTVKSKESSGKIEDSVSREIKIKNRPSSLIQEKRNFRNTADIVLSSITDNVNKKGKERQREREDDDGRKQKERDNDSDHKQRERDNDSDHKQRERDDDGGRSQRERDDGGRSQRERDDSGRRQRERDDSGRRQRERDDDSDHKQRERDDSSRKQRERDDSSRKQRERDDDGGRKKEDDGGRKKEDDSTHKQEDDKNKSLPENIFVPFVLEPIFSGVDDNSGDSDDNRTILFYDKNNVRVKCDTVLLILKEDIPINIYFLGKNMDLAIDGQHCSLDVSSELFADGQRRMRGMVKRDSENILYIEVQYRGKLWNAGSASETLFQIDTLFMLRSR